MVCFSPVQFSPVPSAKFRRFALALFGVTAALLMVAACGGQSTVSGGDPGPTGESIPATTTSMATTTTMRRDIPGSQLAPGANTIYVLGDSVTLGAKVQMPIALPGWNLTFDAKESRRIDQGAEVVASAGGAMGRVLVVHLCSNWGSGDYSAAATKLMVELKGVDRVVWVTCTPWTSEVGRADEAIRSFANNYPNVVIADWAKVSATPGYTDNDGLHLQTPGAEALAALIAAVVGPAPAAG